MCSYSDLTAVPEFDLVSSDKSLCRLLTCLRLHLSLLWYTFLVDGDDVDFREYYVPATSFISFRLVGYMDDCCCLSIWFAKY